MASRGGVRGAGELKAAFLQLAKAPTVAQRRKAREAALAPIKRAADMNLLANGSVVTGALRASLDIDDAPNRRNTSVLGQRTGTVLGMKPASYAHLVEFSVKPHYQPRRFGGIMHPGHPGYPFMRPAFEQNRDFAGKVYLQAIFQAIQTAAAAAPKARRKR